MRRGLRIVGGLILLVLVVALVALLVFPGRVVRQAIVTGGPLLLKTDVTVDAVHVAMRKGTLTIENLTVGSPEGFRAESMFKLERVHIDIDPRSLFTDTVHVREILVDRPEITYEAGLRGSNIGALLETLEQEQAEADEDDAPGKKVVIDHVRVANARVRVGASITGGRGAVLSLPTLELRDLGREPEADDEGITILGGLVRIVREVVRAVTGVITGAGGVVLDAGGAALDAGGAVGGAAIEGGRAVGRAAGDGVRALGRGIGGVLGGGGDEDAVPSDEDDDSAPSDPADDMPSLTN